MQSAFGVEHGEISKGLPRAVADGGGGEIGALMRAKHKAGAKAGGFNESRPRPAGYGRELGRIRRMKLQRALEEKQR